MRMKEGARRAGVKGGLMDGGWVSEAVMTSEIKDGQGKKDNKK